MGLRIGQSAGILGSLRNLRSNLQGLNKANEKLASGLAINRASDNPSGLIISQLFGAELGSLGQAVENTQNSANLINTAEGALSEVGGQLIELRRLAVSALNTGGLDSNAQSALQSQADNILQSINRIGGTTRFGRTPLLNGSREFTTSGTPAEIENLNIQSARLGSDGTRTIDIEITAAATAATATGTIAATQAVDSTVRISGALGSATLEFAAGATTAEVESAINAVTDFTGVVAEGGVISSAEVGSDQTVGIDVVSGDLAGITEGTTEGTDIVASIAGAPTSGDGNTVTANGVFFSGDVRFADTVTPGTVSFTITGGGAQLQLGEGATGFDNLRIGISGISSSTLGGSATSGDTLSSVGSGGSNDLLTNPGGALAVIDAAINEVNDLRGNLGAVSQQVLEPNVRSLEIAIENITASRSSILDADIAEQIAEQVRATVLLQANVSVLANQNLQSGNVLRLLQGLG